MLSPATCSTTTAGSTEGQVVAGRVEDDGGHGDAGLAGGPHGGGLVGHRAGRIAARALALEDQRAAVEAERPRLPRRATREPAELGHGAVEQPPEITGERVGRLHRRSLAVLECQGLDSGRSHSSSGCRPTQQWARTVGYGLTAAPPPGWISKCRCGLPAALPVSPT